MAARSCPPVSRCCAMSRWPIPPGERRTLPYPDKELTRLGIDEGSMVVLTADGTLKKA